MKNNIFEITRSVYGSETSNMQPIAFGYVPANKRGDARKTTSNSASRNGENRSNRGNLNFRDMVDQNG